MYWWSNMIRVLSLHDSTVFLFFFLFFIYQNYFCVVLLCVFMFRVPCCDVRYKPCSVRLYHQLFVRGLINILLMLFVLVYIKWCPPHIVLCFCVVFLHLVYPMLPVSLDIHFRLPIWYSLTFISKKIVFPTFENFPG